jgi:cytochrome c553
MIRKRTLLALFVALVCYQLPALAAENSAREPFNDRYCTTCHGTDGRGNYSVQAPRLAGMEPWYLKRQLENFRAGIRGTHASDVEGIAMRPMAAKLSDASIVDIIDWVGSWEYKPTEITLEGNVAVGERLYTQCATCHGADGKGNEALGAPALRGQNDWYLATQLRNFIEGWRGSHPQDSFGQQMTVMAQSLQNDEGINNVVSYINTLGRN